MYYIRIKTNNRQYIKRGERITDAMIGVKRPGTGLSPACIDKIISRVVKCDIKNEEQFTFEQLK